MDPSAKKTSAFYLWRLMGRLHRTLTLALLGLTIIALGALLFAAYSSGSDNQEGPFCQLGSPFGIYSPGSLDEVPTSAGSTMVATLGLNSLQAYEEYLLSLVQDIGVDWVRIDFLYNGWNFSEPAQYLEKLHDEGIEVVGTARPLNNFVSADLTAYQANLRHLLRRYPWIKVWQIGNEPNLFWENPDDYPRFFQAGQQVIRETCPDCQIMLAGAAARFPNQQQALGVYDRIIGAITAQSPDDDQPFDIFDMHYYRYYGEEDDMLESLRGYRELLAKHGLTSRIEFWITETATTSGQPSWPPGSPAQTEQQQAEELVKRFVTMLAADVKRVSWARIYENYQYGDAEDIYFDHAGIIYNGLGEEKEAGIGAGTKKQAYFAYKTLAAKLKGCYQTRRLSPGQFEFSFSGKEQSLFILWGDGGRLPGEIKGRVAVTDLTGSRSEQEASEILLTSMPIFVEPLSP